MACEADRVRSWLESQPLTGSTNLIESVIGLPFAPQLAILVALLETVGGLAAAIGLGTRIFAPMLAVQMLFVSFTLWPTYPWIDRDIEYPLILGFVALLISMRGGESCSVDACTGGEFWRAGVCLARA